MPKVRGRYLALTAPRRIICDLLHFAQRIPTVPVQRQMNIGPLIAARQQLAARPSWVTLFAKALDIVARRMPTLRRSFLTAPTERLYEHERSVASVAIEREFQGEPAVFFARLTDLHSTDVRKIEAELAVQRTAPVESIKHFRRTLKMARWPKMIRRLAWWAGLNLSGRWRERYFGTFGVSVYSGLGAESLHPLGPLTLTLNYGVIGDNGDVEVRIVYDHRVMDGATVARALLQLEKVLNGEMVAELESLASEPEPSTPPIKLLAG